MSFIRSTTIASLALTAIACSSDHHASGAADAAADGARQAAFDAGHAAGGSTGADASGGNGGADAGPWTFPGSPGLPTNAPWGPNLLGLQDHSDGSGDPSDIAFGLFWDPAVVSVPFVGGGCIAFGTAPGSAGGRDIGAVTVTGGADSGVQSLKRDPNVGDYFLDGASNPWRIGDQLSVTAGSVHAGPLTVPTPFASENLSSQTSFSRGTATLITFSGSNAKKVAFSVSAHNSGQMFLLACEGDAASGKLTIPAAALSAFPSSVTSIDAKLSPVNLTQTGDLAFFVAGESAEASLMLLPD